jgi:hypothetical protein
MALIMSFAVPQFGLALKVNLSNTSRQLASTIRATHDEAVLKGLVYRLAFDIGKGEYWAEVGERSYLLRTEEQASEEKRKLEKLTSEERAARKDPFQMASGVTKKKIKLPTGVKFDDIQTAHSKEPVKAGIVYAFFFPHGFVEKLVVHLKDSFERQQTLAVNSVTGKSRLFERYVKDVE